MKTKTVKNPVLQIVSKNQLEGEARYMVRGVNEPKPTPVKAIVLKDAACVRIYHLDERIQRGIDYSVESDLGCGVVVQGEKTKAVKVPKSAEEVKFYMHGFIRVTNWDDRHDINELKSFKQIFFTPTAIFAVL